MSNISFEWSMGKEKANINKHKVSFKEAKTVFFDEYASQYFDNVHSGIEERFLMLGFSIKLRLLIVSHTYRKRDHVIRIILARKASKNEIKYYRS